MTKQCANARRQQKEPAFRSEMMSFGSSNQKSEKHWGKISKQNTAHREERYRRRYAQQQPNSKATMTTEMGW